MIKMLIELNNCSFHQGSIGKALTIHFNFVNSIKLSPSICHLMEKFGVAVTIHKPMLLRYLTPVNIQRATHQGEFFFNFQSFNSILPREGPLLLFLIQRLHLLHQICHLKL